MTEKYEASVSNTSIKIHPTLNGKTKIKSGDVLKLCEACSERTSIENGSYSVELIRCVEIVNQGA